MTADRIIPEAGHRFSYFENKCEVCGMPRYVFLSARRVKCGTPECAAVMKRYNEAMARMDA